MAQSPVRSFDSFYVCAPLRHGPFVSHFVPMPLYLRVAHNCEYRERPHAISPPPRKIVTHSINDRIANDKMLSYWYSRRFQTLTQGAGLTQ